MTCGSYPFALALVPLVRPNLISRSEGWGRYHVCWHLLRVVPITTHPTDERPSSSAAPGRSTGAAACRPSWSEAGRDAAPRSSPKSCGTDSAERETATLAAVERQRGRAAGQRLTRAVRLEEAGHDAAPGAARTTTGGPTPPNAQCPDSPGGTGTCGRPRPSRPNTGRVPRCGVARRVVLCE